MPHRIWKRIGDTYYGYGHGFKAVIYEYSRGVLVTVYQGETTVKAATMPDVKAAKRWAEKYYLKGPK